MQNSKLQKIGKNNRGVVLLMVVFMMSIFLAAGMALSSVFLRSLQSSKNLSESLTAFHAADSGLEHIVYTTRNLLPDPVGDTNICESSGPPADSGAFHVGEACYVPVRKETATEIFVFSFGKFPATNPRISRSLGAFFEK